MTDLTSFDGTRLALTPAGPSDAPPIVLVHGLGPSTDSWGEVPARLAERHRVIAYDLRGHGRSGNARSGDYGLDAHARDLTAVLATCVPDGQRAVLVGHSLGGGIILAAARLTGTGRTAGVVFAGSGGSGVTAPGLPARRLPSAVTSVLRRAWFGLLRGTARLGRRLRSVEWVADWLVRRVGVGPAAPPQVVARMRESFLSTRRRPWPPPAWPASATTAPTSRPPSPSRPWFPTAARIPRCPRTTRAHCSLRLPTRSWSSSPVPATCCRSPTELRSPTRSPGGLGGCRTHDR